MISRQQDGWGAVFSDDEAHRYLLWRDLRESQLLSLTLRGTVLFIMLNPSTADEKRNDPTVAGCVKRAMLWSYERIVVCNIFALRSTDPRALYQHQDPIGAENDVFITSYARQADKVICAWGGHGALLTRGRYVAGMLAVAGVPMYCLRVNQDGHPSHPLYLPHRLQPRLWQPWAPGAYGAAACPPGAPETA